MTASLERPVRERYASRAAPEVMLVPRLGPWPNMSACARSRNIFNMRVCTRVRANLGELQNDPADCISPFSNFLPHLHLLDEISANTGPASTNRRLSWTYSGVDMLPVDGLSRWNYAAVVRCRMLRRSGAVVLRPARLQGLL